MPAGLADALAHPVCQFEMVAVARRQVVAGLRNADDRLAGLQFFAGQAVIEVALQIERGHPRIVRVVKPLEGAESSALAIDGSIVVAFFHWFLPHCKPYWDGSNHGSGFQHAQNFIRCKRGRSSQFLILITDLSSLQKIALSFSQLRNVKFGKFGRHAVCGIELSRIMS